MFKQDIKRAGWACKFVHPNQSSKKQILEDLQRPLNTRSTTVAWLNRQKTSVAEERLWDIMQHNILSYYKLIKYAGELPDELRMVRLGSDVLPVYTEPSWSYFWQNSDVKKYCEREFAKVGDLARQLDVRLSMHPGQFTVLASDNPDIVQRSIDEFEYHVDVIRWMGYGKQFQDFKCNVHVSGRRGVEGIKETLTKISPEARNVITFENDEYTTSIDELIKLKDDAALVYDNHHHWINSGEHIKPTDDRYKQILESWRGVRPAMHYSVSREEYLSTTDLDSLPIMESLLQEGHKKGKLRAHSDYYTNNALNDLMYEFWQYSDIMCESKFKNLASIKLHKYFKEKEQ
jgi:UV DNA damage endonuclease